MINLLPPQGYTSLRREYMLRVGATVLFLFGGVCAILVVASIPTFVLISAQIDALEIDVVRNEYADDSFIEAGKEVDETRAIVAQLASDNGPIRASDIITEVERYATGGIVFKNYVISNAEPGIAVQVQGVAPTRKSLAALKNALEESALIEEVELPIADLARDVDVPFAMTLTLVADNEST